MWARQKKSGGKFPNILRVQTTPDPSKICVKHTSLKSKIPTPDVTMANFKTPISPRFPTTTRWHFGFVFFFFCCEHYVSVCFLLRTQCSAISASCFLCSVYVRAHTWANILDLTFRNCSLFWSHASLYFSENRAIETCQSHCCGNVQKTSKNKFENCSPGSQGRGHGLFSLKAFFFGGGRRVSEIEMLLILGIFRYIPYSVSGGKHENMNKKIIRSSVSNQRIRCFSIHSTTGGLCGPY